MIKLAHRVWSHWAIVFLHASRGGHTALAAFLVAWILFHDDLVAAVLLLSGIVLKLSRTFPLISLCLSNCSLFLHQLPFVIGDQLLHDLYFLVMGLGHICLVWVVLRIVTCSHSCIRIWQISQPLVVPLLYLPFLSQLLLQLSSSAILLDHLACSRCPVLLLILPLLDLLAHELLLLFYHLDKCLFTSFLLQFLTLFNLLTFVFQFILNILGPLLEVLLLRSHPNLSSFLGSLFQILFTLAHKSFVKAYFPHFSNGFSLVLCFDVLKNLGMLIHLKHLVGCFDETLRNLLL